MGTAGTPGKPGAALVRGRIRAQTLRRGSGTGACSLDIRSWHHLQDEGQFGNAVILSAFNYAKGQISGLEFSTTYPDQGLSGYANLSLTRARGTTIETGQFNFDPAELAYINSNWVHLDHEQRLCISGGIAYRWAGSTTLSSDLLYGSGLRDGFANTEHLPSYTQVNAAAERTFDLGPALAKIGGRLTALNVFDRIYKLRDGTGIGVGAPQYGPRRMFFVAVAKTF